MRSHAERPATRSPRSTEHAQSCAARRPESQSPAASYTSAALGHRFEKIAIDPVRFGERQSGEGVARLRPAAWSAPIQRKQVWNGVWLGESDERRRERELEEERQRERQRQLDLQRQEQPQQIHQPPPQNPQDQLPQIQQPPPQILEDQQPQIQQPPPQIPQDQLPQIQQPPPQNQGLLPNYGSFNQPLRHIAVNRGRSDSEDEGGMDVPLLGQQRPSRWSRFKSWVGRKLDSNGANFVSINSPGTQTGVVGGVSGVNTALSVPTTVPKLKHSGYTSNMTSPTTGIGAGLNILGGVSDLVATGQGLNNMSKEGGVRGFFRGIRDTFSLRRNETGAQAETRSTAKRLAVDTTVNLTDAANQGMQGANAISSLMHGGTSVLPHALGGVTAGIGAGVQGVVAGRAAWRMGRAWHHKRKVDAIRNSQEFGQMSPENQAAAHHMSQQLGKRRTRNIIGGLGATAGAVGGGLLLGSLVGGAALLGPIGWGLIGASALVAAGLGIHKLYRHYKKKKAGTLGTDRQTHADNLHNAVVGGHQQNKADALRILGSHGITEAQASDPVKGRQLIRRKLEGW